MSREEKENVISWMTGDDFMSVTLTQRKYITKVKRIASKIADEQPSFKVNLYENNNGSIFCHLPLKALKLYLKSPKGDEDETEETEE